MLDGSDLPLGVGVSGRKLPVSSARCRKVFTASASLGFEIARPLKSSKTDRRETTGTPMYGRTVERTRRGANLTSLCTSWWHRGATSDRCRPLTFRACTAESWASSKVGELHMHW